MRIHTFSAPPEKFFVNSFIIEGESGVFLVDTQFLLSTATALAERVAALGKPLEAVVITHPHPDHFNGLPTILQRFGPVPVLATAETRAGMVATQAAKRAAWTPVYGDDYPPTDALPTQVVGPDETVTLAGMAVRMIDLGAGESADMSVLLLPEAETLIASDLVYSECHPWLAEHRTTAWLQQLDRLVDEFSAVRTVHAGHGPAGGSALFAAQHRYITAFRARVQDRMRAGGLDAAGLAAVTRDTLEGRGEWPLAMLVEMNAKAVAEELGAAAGSG